MPICVLVERMLTPRNHENAGFCNFRNSTLFGKVLAEAAFEFTFSSVGQRRPNRHLPQHYVANSLHLMRKHAMQYTPTPLHGRRRRRRRRRRREQRKKRDPARRSSSSSRREAPLPLSLSKRCGGSPLTGP